nr:hypothetical protein [Sodalis-like endosymbiont of Proechinophthirus fluctus]
MTHILQQAAIVPDFKLDKLVGVAFDKFGKTVENAARGIVVLNA